MKLNSLYITILVTLITISSTNLVAQNRYDALRYSKNYYEGTARSIGVGNAMTSVGGDMGAITLNPAASAVYRYNEVLITPAVYGRVDETNYIGNNTRDSKAKFTVPSLGIIGCFDTGRSRGVKNVNLSASYSGLNSYQSRTSASGEEANTSWLASTAMQTNGIYHDNLTIKDGNNWDDPYYTGAPWRSVLAWNTFLIDTLPGYNDEYVAGTENIYDQSIEVGGPLQQEFYKNVSGHNSELNLNISMNISDIVYLGFSVGIQSIYYNQKEVYLEEAVNPNDFQTGFDYLKHTYSQVTSGAGYNSKFGIIITPVTGLRIGTSFATPTLMSMTDTWEEILETKHDLLDDGFAQEYSPIGESNYTVISPFKVNSGISYVFGKYGFISLDHEYIDYSMIKMRNNYEEDFAEENKMIKRRFSKANNYRVGGELRIIPAMAVRAGYNYYASAEESYDAEQELASLGIGYRSKGGLFIDLGYQQQLNSITEEYTLYENYSDVPELQAPIMANTYRKWKLLLTLGVRF